MTTHLHRFWILFGVLATSFLGGSVAWAHGGENHGDEGNGAAPNVALLARAWAQSDDFELVAVLNESPSASRRLLITVDRFKSNEPVVGAKLAVEVAGQSLPVLEQTPGVYTFESDVVNTLTPGTKLPLTISVETTDSADLLTTTFELPNTAESGTASRLQRSDYIVWAASTALVLAAALLLVVRRHRFTTRTPS